jgi:hypothetical protein
MVNQGFIHALDWWYCHMKAFITKNTPTVSEGSNPARPKKSPLGYY